MGFEIAISLLILKQMQCRQKRMPGNRASGKCAETVALCQSRCRRPVGKGRTEYQLGDFKMSREVIVKCAIKSSQARWRLVQLNPPKGNLTIRVWSRNLDH